MSTITESFSNAGKLMRQALGAALSTVHAGEEKITSYQPEHSSTQVLTVSSSAFLHATPIPRKYTPQGENMSPDLAWVGIPENTKEIVLIVEDPDAPMLSPFVHWILHGLSGSARSIPAGLAPADRLSQLGGALQGQNDAKTRGWSGPKPPLGHGVHHYHFQVFALDARLALGPGATLNELSKAMAGHVLADGELIGTYERTAESD